MCVFKEIDLMENKELRMGRSLASAKLFKKLQLWWLGGWGSVHSWCPKQEMTLSRLPIIAE